MARPGPRNLITDVAGLSVGQAEDRVALSGVTVLLTEKSCLAAVDVRGGAPGTRETEALDPVSLGGSVDAITLAGGSVYGLDAASGAVRAGAAFGLRPTRPRRPSCRLRSSSIS